MEYKVNNLLYAAGPDMLNTIRTDVTLTEPVNVQALEKAVQTATEIWNGLIQSPAEN